MSMDFTMNSVHAVRSALADYGYNDINVIADQHDYLDDEHIIQSMFNTLTPVIGVSVMGKYFNLTHCTSVQDLINKIVAELYALH